MLDRGTAPFTVFYRRASGEGGFTCDRCGARRHDTFARMGEAFATAAQHLNLCRGTLANRPVEGTAIVDGRKHAVVLRTGIMILALNAVFRGYGQPVRAIA